MYTHKNTEHSQTPIQNPVSGGNRPTPDRTDELVRRWGYALQEWRLQAMDWLTLLCPPDPGRELPRDFLDTCRTVAYLDQIHDLLLSSQGEKLQQVLEILEEHRTIDEMEAANEEGWEILLEAMTS